MIWRAASLVVFLCVAFVVRAEDVPPPGDLPIDPSVTQDNYRSTLCGTGWAKAVGPMWPVIVRIKREKVHTAGLFDPNKGRFKLDYLIPLALGGAAADPRNLALAPWAEVKEKEVIEACLSVAVCTGRVTLREAQQAIWKDWRAASALCRIF